MSKQEEAEGREVKEKMINLWSPLDLERDLYFHLPPSPQSPGLCLSPLWNFYQDNHHEFTGESRVMTSTTNGLPRIDFPRSPGNQSPSLQCLKSRIIQALFYIKESAEQQVLAQVWAPVKRGTQYVLTTSGQPFLLDIKHYGLAQYRLISTVYTFSADTIDGVLGLPGRVFRTKLPEWTPNAQYYSSMEYPQLKHAILYNVRGMLALPLFDYGGCCIGVLELVMTSQKITYAPEIDLVCKALECVKLKSSEIFDLRHAHNVDENEQIRLGEILELLTAVSETYKLPLAQTWIPNGSHNVVACSRGLCASTRFEERLMKQHCLSTCNIAFYVTDAHMWGFREASNEHNLIDGQGVVGRAYLSLKSCFCKDVSRFPKTEYPLVHYARLFGLCSCFAVPLCNNQTGKEIYILEFFLPPTLADFRHLQKILDFLSATISQSSPNLRMASRKEFSKGETVELIHYHEDKKPALCAGYSQKQKNIKPSKYGHKNSTTFETISCMYVPEMNSDEQPGVQEVDFTYRKTKIDGDKRNLPFIISGKEDKWSLEVIEQLYGKSLQDAADCLGVSRSTMKRICRKHGVSRWPSYKRKLTGRLFHKLACNNELLQGSEGATSCSSPNLCPESALARPGTHLGQLLTGNMNFTRANLQTQSANKHISQCSGELPSIVGPQLENMVSNVDATTPRSSNGAAIQGERTALIKIKATYGEYIIRFTLHYPSTMVDLEKEVQKRLKLKLGTFTLKYLDADSDWILIACDEDLEDLLEVFLSKGIIRMLVGNINHL